MRDCDLRPKWISVLTRRERASSNTPHITPSHHDLHDGDITKVSHLLQNKSRDHFRTNLSRGARRVQQRCSTTTAVQQSRAQLQHSFFIQEWCEECFKTNSMLSCRQNGVMALLRQLYLNRMDRSACGNRTRILCIE